MSAAYYWKVHQRFRIRGVFSSNTRIWGRNCWFCFRWYALCAILKGLPILANAIEKLKWSAFTQIIQSDSLTAFERNIRGLQAAYLSNDSNTCKESYKIFLEGRSMEVHVLHKEFTDRSAAVAEMVWYLETLLKMVIIFKNLMSPDREKTGKVICKLYRTWYQLFIVPEV